MNGFDINSDGQSDFSQSEVSNEFPSLAGRRLAQTRADHLVASIQAVSPSDMMQVPIKKLHAKTLSIQALQRSKLLGSDELASLQRQYGIGRDRLRRMRLHGEAYAIYSFSFGDRGALLLYEDVGGVLEAHPPVVAPGNMVPATSWATPNALAQDVCKRYGRGRLPARSIPVR